MTFRSLILVTALCAAAAVSLRASQELRDHGPFVISPEAWSWNLAPWDSEKVISWNDYQYTIYWDKDGYLALARRNLNDDTVQSIRFTDARISLDNPHNSTAIGFSPVDGRLHISYHQWVSRLRYRRSDPGFITSPPATLSTSHFGGEEAMVGQNEGQVTYPRFFNLNDGTLLFIYRGDGGSSSSDSFLNRYNATTGKWERIGMLFSRSGSYSPPGYTSSTSRNAYLNDIVVDRNNRIHLSWTFREGSGHQTNHDLHYATSDDGGVTWQNNSGGTIANLPAGVPIRITSPGIKVVHIPYYSWLINQDTMVVDSEGQPHVVTQISSVVTSNLSQRNIHFIHYRRSPDGQWHANWVDPVSVSRSGARARGALLIDERDDLHFYTVEGGIFKYWVSRAVGNWQEWTARNLFSGYTGEGFRYDRRLWRNNGVLSVPLVTYTGAYHLRTFTLSPSPGSVRLGDFGRAGDLEGWNPAKHLETGVRDGMLHLEFLGNDPILRKAGLYHDAGLYRYIKVRLRNRSDAASAALFFLTDTDRTWNYQKAKTFSIVPNDDFPRTYLIDMSDRAGWNGTLVAVRLDPAENPSAGGAAVIEWIELSDSADIPSPIDDWRRIHFSDQELEDELISGDPADPTGDGVPNLVNYALGNDPRQSQRNRLPVMELSADGWVFHFERPDPPPEDLGYLLESSSDLVDWAPADASSEILPVAEGRQRVVYSGSVSGESRFLRLRIIRR